MTALKPKITFMQINMNRVFLLMKWKRFSNFHMKQNLNLRRFKRASRRAWFLTTNSNFMVASVIVVTISLQSLMSISNPKSIEKFFRNSSGGNNWPDLNSFDSKIWLKLMKGYFYSFYFSYLEQIFIHLTTEISVGLSMGCCFQTLKHDLWHTHHMTFLKI